MNKVFSLIIAVVGFGQISMAAEFVPDSYICMLDKPINVSAEKNSCQVAGIEYAFSSKSGAHIGSSLASAPIVFRNLIGKPANHECSLVASKLKKAQVNQLTKVVRSSKNCQKQHITNLAANLTITLMKINLKHRNYALSYADIYRSSRSDTYTTFPDDDRVFLLPTDVNNGQEERRLMNEVEARRLQTQEPGTSQAGQ